MQISKEIRQQALTALGKREGLSTLVSMFNDGRLDRNFAVREIKRRVPDYQAFRRVEVLCEAAGIGRRELQEIANEVCLRLLRVGFYYLGKGNTDKASSIESQVESLICDYGLSKDENGNVSSAMREKIRLMYRVREKQGAPNLGFIRGALEAQGFEL